MSRLSWDGGTVPDIYIQLEQTRMELRRAKQLSFLTILMSISIGIVIGIVATKFNLI